MSKIKSIVQLENTIKECLLEGNLNFALKLIHKVVNQIFCEPINTARIFSSSSLDDYCQQIGAITVKSLEVSTSLIEESNEKLKILMPTVVYIASKLQSSGGHSAVLADLIKLSPKANVYVLITGISGLTDHDALKARFDSDLNISFEYAPRKNYADKLIWIQKRLLTLRPSDVWLFNHHQDSVAVAAVQPNQGYKLHFYHHGDHHLCLGVHLAFAEHIDIHPMGFHYCRNELDINNNIYLPIVVQDYGARSNKWHYKEGNGFTTCTVGGFNKIEIPYFIQYIDLIPELLKVSSGSHVHIGKLTDFALKKIRNKMRKLNVPASAFLYIPFVENVWVALNIYKVDLYITSFPYGGARTLIEVMGAGVPVAAHSHCTSRLLGTFDMVYEGALIWRYPSQLYEFISNINSETLQKQSYLSRKKYVEFHTEDKLKNALRRDAKPLLAPNLIDGYIPDNLQLALDISNQVTILGVFRRFFYRNYRLMKSAWA